MNTNGPQDLSGFSMMELFRAEAETQKARLVEGLLAIESDPTDAARLEQLMRASHSLKGAARLVELHAAVTIAHLMEDCFVAAQRGRINLGDPATLRRLIDLMLRGADLLDQIVTTPEMELATRQSEMSAEISRFGEEVTRLASAEAGQAGSDPGPTGHPAPDAAAPSETPGPVVLSPSQDRALRITAENLNHLLALAGEAQVEARRLRPFADSLFRLKRHLADVTLSLDGLRETLGGLPAQGPARAHLVGTQRKLAESRQYLAAQLAELDTLDRRAAGLTQRLYLQALACRMRPFADATRGLSRVVRDLARSLGKEARLEVLGADTPVDRDILEIVESQIAQLLRNAVDHGIETPEVRHEAGKPPVGTVWLEARHNGGQLLVTCGDDGRGIDPEALRAAIVTKGLAPEDTAAKLSVEELFEFLFLPGFTMKPSVTELSGRGVGLDVVQTLVKAVRGSVRVSSQPGASTRFELQLPLTLSVLRALLVEVAGEPYAFPLASIRRTVDIARDAVTRNGSHAETTLDGRALPLATARELFNQPAAAPDGDDLHVLVLGSRDQWFGVVVDRFTGEQEIVVRTLDPRLGKMMGVSAAAILEDGTPALIADADDVVHAIEKLIAVGSQGIMPAPGVAAPRRKRVLVADDSLTVRELERKVLAGHGYAVELAVDGMDAWNAVRMGAFDLVVTDVDMPRLGGYEFTRLLKSDAGLRAVPVMMISYKDREEDRLRGLAAGADFYLAKSRFNEAGFLDAVRGLIGEPCA